MVVNDGEMASLNWMPSKPTTEILRRNADAQGVERAQDTEGRKIVYGHDSGWAARFLEQRTRRGIATRNPIISVPSELRIIGQARVSQRQLKGLQSYLRCPDSFVAADEADLSMAQLTKMPHGLPVAILEIDRNVSGARLCLAAIPR